jgi:hypothetical protein
VLIDIAHRHGDGSRETVQIVVFTRVYVSKPEPEDFAL